MFRNLFSHPATLLILILLIVILLGWKKLPDMARSLGRSSRILKSEIDEMKSESKSKASSETVEGQATRHDTAAPHDNAPHDGATRADERRDY